MSVRSLITHVLALVAIFAGVVLAQRAALAGPVYASVLQMGERAGRVLPQGVNTKSRLESNLRVTLRPVGSGPAAAGERVADPEPIKRLDRDGVDLGLAAMMAAAYASVLVVVALARRRRGVERSWALSARQTALACAVCIVSAGLVSVMRVFWTGADRAFFERSLVQLPGSKSIRVRGDLLLSMSGGELALMVLAAVLTALPALLAIDARSDGREVSAAERDRRSVFAWLSAQRLLSDRVGEHSLKWVMVICYVLLTAALWTAPWSTTMAEALWGGAPGSVLNRSVR